MQPDKLLSVKPLKKYAIFPSISYQNKPPAIFKKIGFGMSYNKVFYTLEILAVIMPVMLTVIIVFILYRYTKRKKIPIPDKDPE